MRLFFSPADAEKQQAREAITQRLAFLGQGVVGEYLFGDRFSTADAFLYVMVRWARDSDIDVPDVLTTLAARVEARPRVQRALQAEGMLAS